MRNDPNEKRSNRYLGHHLPSGACYVSVNGKELLPGPSQQIWNHSPDGFEWGYCGSGPAQLALAILLYEYGDPILARCCHQDFKRDVIAGFPRQRDSGWTMSSAAIDAWMAAHPPDEEQLQLLRLLHGEV